MRVNKPTTNEEGADAAPETMKENTTCGTSIQGDLLLHIFHTTLESLPALPEPNAPERMGAGELPASATSDLPPSGLGRWATDMPRESLCRLTSPLLAPKGIRRWEFEIPALPPGRRERAKKPTRH